MRIGCPWRKAPLLLTNQNIPYYRKLRTTLSEKICRAEMDVCPRICYDQYVSSWNGAESVCMGCGVTGSFVRMLNFRRNKFGNI
jgi:hypothetical protein